MTEWLREGIEGRSLKATLRLYLLGLMVLAPAAALLALAFGGHTSFVATPLLVFIVVAVEYAISYRIRLRDDFGKLLWKVRVLMIGDFRETSVACAGSVNVGPQLGAPIDLPKEEKTLESLVHTMLYDGDASVRASAAKALGAIGDSRAVDSLIAVLRDKDPLVRYWAAVALIEIGDLRAVTPLVSALGDEDASVRSSAASALSQLGSSAEQTVIAREIVERLRRRRTGVVRKTTIDESDGASLNDTDVSRSAESGRKRA